MADHVPGLLVIEADAETVRRQGHCHVIDSVEKGLASKVREGKIRFKRFPIFGRDDLTEGASLARAGVAKYDAVIIVGHGDPQGIVAAPDLGVTWGATAEALAPLEPRALLAISCFAASTTPLSALFGGIPSLQIVMGSPVFLNARQAQAAIVELLALLWGFDIPPELSAAAAMFNALATRGVVFKRARPGFESATRGQLAWIDILSLVARAVLESD